jgi:hypothetical protein
MANTTLEEAVRFLSVHTMKMNLESKKWHFTVREVDTMLKKTKADTIEFHMLNIIRQHAINSNKQKV